MAKTDAADIFMTIVGDGGPLPGESLTQLQTPGRPNPLVNGFNPGQMFEITKFSFGVGVEQQALDDLENNGAAMARQLGLVGQQARQFATAAQAQAGRRSPGPATRRSKPGQTLGESPVTVQPISFTRAMDKASYLLLHHVIKRTFFKKVSLVKRKSAGGGATGEAYLRLDFVGVLLIEASWSNDDPIEETYSFHARAITVRYKLQLPDGSLGAPRVGFWSMVPDEKEAPL